MKKALCLSLAALLLLSACAPGAGEADSPSLPVESPPASTAPPSPEQSPPPAGGGVWSDWSALEPYEPTELIFHRWYEEPVHELIPLDGGYGVLVPFVGSAPPDMSWGGVYEYGLMTTDGTIVVDTAYSYVSRLFLWEGAEPVRLPVLALMTTPGLMPEVEWREGEQRCGVAALDGSWAVPTEYDGMWAFSPEGFFLWDEDAVYVFHTDGQLLHSIPYASTARLEEFYGGVKLDEGILTELEGTTLRLIDLETGESVYVEGVSELGWPGSGLFPVCSSDSGLWGCVDAAGAWVIPPKYEYILTVLGGLTVAYTGGAYLYVDREGNEYEEDPRPPQPQPDGGGDEFTETTTDPYTGEVYRLERGGLFGYRVLDEAGNVLGNSTAYNSELLVVNGLFLNIDSETAGYKDRDGNWVFRISLAEAGD